MDRRRLHGFGDHVRGPLHCRETGGEASFVDSGDRNAKVIHREGNLAVDSAVADRPTLGQPGEGCAHDLLGQPGNRLTESVNTTNSTNAQTFAGSEERQTQRAGNRARRAWTRRTEPVGHYRRERVAKTNSRRGQPGGESVAKQTDRVAQPGGQSVVGGGCRAGNRATNSSGQSHKAGNRGVNRS